MSSLTIVGMSGGVDSSVAAALLSRDRHVAGMFMKNWEEDDRSGVCPAEEDAEDARSVAERLGIKLYTRNFSVEYWDNVFEHFLAEYTAGRTPNPDILCNREIKFKTFLEHAEDLGAQSIATGHYARRAERGGRYLLIKGKDNNKDQSYFLYTLGQEQLRRTLFPVGELDKPHVRQIADELNLHVHDKKDSTGICFIGERNFRNFLGEYLPAKPGPILSTSREPLGEHPGLMYFTLGQRKGLGIGGTRHGTGEPWFVVHKDMDSRTLFVAQGDDHLLYSNELIASELTWVDGSPPSGKFVCAAKTRYRQPDQACEVVVLGDKVRVRFSDSQRAVTPGQSVVFYDDEVCLGGGVIESTNAPVTELEP